MCDKECVPAVYIRGKKKGQIISCRRHGAARARRELIKRDGPPPFPGALCRHLCENDSSAPNGFICTLHTVWGTRSENELDKPEEVRKAGGKVGSKVANSIERTCPYCGRTIRGPGYFRHERACYRRLQVSLLPNDAGR